MEFNELVESFAASLGVEGAEIEGGVMRGLNRHTAIGRAAGDMEAYGKFLAEVRKETGIEAIAPDDAGLVTVNVDGKFNLNLQFVEATGKVLCFVEVAQLPADTPKDVYRDLLAGGLFGRDTAGGYFALELDTETVVYNYYFDFEKAKEDVEAFVSTLENILQLCDIWAERMKGIPAAVPAASSDAGHHGTLGGHGMLRV